MTESSSRAYNLRLGLVLFAIYLLLYVVFVMIAAFRTEWMELRPFGGMNLAVLYGFGLIIVAIALSLVFGLLCKSDGAAQSVETTSDNKVKQ